MNIFTIDIGGSFIKYALIDEKRCILYKDKIKTPHKDVETLYETLYSIIPDKVEAIAISMPGVIDSENGIAVTGGALRYIQNEPIKKILKDKYSVEVSIGNDAKCAALAEVGYGAFENVKDGFLIVLGTGIGGCLVIDRKVHFGSRLAAGEVSSIVVNNNNPITNKDFWCMVNGSQGLLHCVQKQLCTDEIFSGEEIFKMIDNGNEKVKDALDEYCHTIAIELFNIQAIVDPQKFAIGGAISAQKILIDTIRKQYLKIFEIFDGPLKPIDIEACRFKNDANLFGAYYQLRMENNKF